ncbi:MAG: ABC transporter permease DevC [Aphanocapsa lilacina HA4352-LM1]|jgi:putative ABC transport system permease protein|nr:ABC transporter permease DevC [Aphanocapsa lilacina HA4352-LM1]
MVDQPYFDVPERSGPAAKPRRRRRIFLAWLQMSREKTRLRVAVLGITFAAVLMMVQLGIRDALFDSATLLHNSLAGEVFLLSPHSASVIAAQPFSDRRLHQTLALPEVQSASGIYVGFAQWENHRTHLARNLYVIGFNPDDRSIAIEGVERYAKAIKQADTVLFDVYSRPEFGTAEIGVDFTRQLPITTEMNPIAGSLRRVTVGGLFQLGPTFGGDANVITSDVNFRRLFPGRKKGSIDIGVIRLVPGTDVERAIRKIRAHLPADVQVLTKDEFKNVDRSYWASSKPLGYIFNLNVIMGFLVGAIIVYQILYTDVSEHLAEYATLKAIGYQDSELLKVVLQEAGLLALLGFIPAFLIASGAHLAISNATHLPIAMTPARAITVLVLTLAMCLISGALAVRRLKAADPADIFN